MNVAAISSVTSTFASHPVARLQGAGASGAASAAATTHKAATLQAVNFGPATVISISPQAQSLIASQGVTGTANSAANGNAAAVATTQGTNPAALAATYQSTAEQVWVQVLGSLGVTESQLEAMPISERNATTAKAEALAEDLMTGQVSAPAGVSSGQEANSIAEAVAAVAG